MNQRQLKAFIFTTEYNSFTKVAKILSTTQSAISKRILALEEELGTQLFLRANNELLLSDTGQRFLPYAIKALNAMENGKNAIQILNQKDDYILKIGIVNFIGIFLIPDFLAEFEKSHPEINLSINYIPQSIQYKSRQNQEIELFINGLHDKQINGFKTIPLWRLPFHIKIAKHHPLAEKPAPTLEEIIEHPAIAPPSSAPSRKLLNQFIAKQGLNIKIQHEADVVTSLIQLTLSGYGWCLLPANIQDPNLVSIYEHPALQLDYYILHAADQVLSAQAKTFIKAISKLKMKP